MAISACSSGGEGLTSYRFGTGAANHLFCAVCGVKSFYQPRSHPEAWSVNLNALDDRVRPRRHGDRLRRPQLGTGAREPRLNCPRRSA